MATDPNRNEGWTQLRIRDEVHARLVTLQEEMTARRDADRRRQGMQVGLRPLSLSDVIQVLLYRHDQHLARSRASTQRKGVKGCS